MATDLSIYKKWIFDNLPIGGLEAFVLCRYTEAWNVPFKVKSELKITYNNPLQNLYVRPEYVKEAEGFVNQGIVNFTMEAIGAFPEKFEILPTKEARKRGYTTQVPYEHLPIGKLTGRYYIDDYGYCWFEMTGYYRSTYLSGGKAPVFWVRETAINYDGKTDLQPDIDEVREIILNERDGSKKLETKKSTKVISLLSLATLLFSSK